MALGATPMQQPRIRVYGMFGSFQVGSGVTDEQRVRVHYFSTVASGTRSPAAGDSLGLLRELKPMRERVRVSDLRDLSSLLQRELDDRRVASELVPYLRGDGSPVGFFPGILVALVPKGFLKSEEGASYPQPQAPAVTTDERVIEYGNYWSAHHFRIGQDYISLGRLEIDPDHTDIVVLDGQHRANAFRFATGTFEAAQAENSIYHAFYDGVVPPQEFTSELPVTAVWFEAEGPIDPKLISRKLFVDVNTNAKEVSASRQVLLDDRNRYSILVGSLYRSLAQRAFDVDVLSLLHMGFDCEETDRHPLTLTVPDQIRYAMSYAGFAPDRFSGVEAGVAKESVHQNANYSRLRSLAPDLEDADLRAAESGDRDAFGRAAEVLDREMAPKLLDIISSFPLTRVHVEASAALAGWVATQGTRVTETWDKVFRGGEGLYAGFMRTPHEGAAGTYRTAIGEISEEFLRLRADLLPGCEQDLVRRAYDTFGSSAGLAGLLMAAHGFCRDHPQGWDAYPEFVERLQRLTPASWAKLLVVYKTGVVKELMPRLWPEIRNIVLRAVQGVDPEARFYDPEFVESFNPDARFLRTQIDRLVNAYLTDVPLGGSAPQRPAPERIASWRAEALRSLRHALSVSDLAPINEEEDLSAYCLDCIEERLRTANITAGLENDLEAAGEGAGVDDATN